MSALAYGGAIFVGKAAVAGGFVLIDRKKREGVLFGTPMQQAPLDDLQEGTRGGS